MIQIIGYILFTLIILVVVKRYLDKKGHPKGLFYLFFAEMWERFSFYGMRALLVLYLIKDFMSELENNEDIAYGIFASYGALVYLTPLIGGGHIFMNHPWFEGRPYPHLLFNYMFGYRVVKNDNPLNIEPGLVFMMKIEKFP